MTPITIAFAGSLAGLGLYHLWEASRPVGQRLKVGDRAICLGKELGIGGTTFQGLDGVPGLAEARAVIIVTDATDPTFVSGRIETIVVDGQAPLVAGHNLPSGLFARVARDKVLSRQAA